METLPITEDESPALIQDGSGVDFKFNTDEGHKSAWIAVGEYSVYLSATGFGGASVKVYPLHDEMDDEFASLRFP